MIGRVHLCRSSNDVAVVGVVGVVVVVGVVAECVDESVTTFLASLLFYSIFVVMSVRCRRRRRRRRRR